MKGWTWRLCRERRAITVQLDYIFIPDRRDFLNVGVGKPRVTIDQQIVLAYIWETGDRENRRY